MSLATATPPQQSQISKYARRTHLVVHRGHHEVLLVIVLPVIDVAAPRMRLDQVLLARVRPGSSLREILDEPADDRALLRGTTCGTKAESSRSLQSQKVVVCMPTHALTHCEFCAPYRKET